MSTNNGRLSPEEISRYSRHLTLAEIGLKGQEKFKAAKVLMIGAGGLGSPIGLYLAAAGVGRIGVVDFDRVDASNLQRQVAHSSDTLNRPKVESIRARMLGINPYIQVDTYEEQLTTDNAIKLFEQYDIVVDGSDNFQTRYLVNDAAYLTRKPLVYGSIFRFEGQLSVFDPHAGGPCYRCLYASPPPPALVPNCAEAGVLGVLPGTVGLIMATETLKLIAGVGEPLRGRLMLYNSLKMQFKEVKIRRNPKCELCGDAPTIHKLMEDYGTFCGITGPTMQLPAANGAVAAENGALEISAAELKRILDKGQRVTLLDVREPHEWDIARIQSAKLTPLSKFDSFIPELKPDDEIYLYCYKGKRSLTALKKLQERGFKHLKSLAGGIDKWSQDVDPSVPRY